MDADWLQSEHIEGAVADVGSAHTLPALDTFNPFLDEEDGSAERADAVRRSTITSKDLAAGPKTLEIQHLPVLRVADATPPELADDLEMGRLNDREYTLGRVLGEGGMGLVQLAHQESLSRDVAIKRVHPEQKSKRGAAALLEEARFMGYLEHPNIIPVHALGRDGDDLPLLVMKRIRGVPWTALIESEEHPAWDRFSGDRLSTHLEIFRQLCNAVAFAHSRGVLHRDIKPDNVMVGEYGEVYLLDWGVARRMDDQVGTDGWRLSGTPAYMAPEMVEPDLAVDARTDVYLLGATLHHVLTGDVRHAGETLANALIAATTNAPAEYRATVPAPLAAICNRACATELDDRFPHVTALREAVATFVQHRGALELIDAAESSLDELQITCAKVRAMRETRRARGLSLVEAVRDGMSGHTELEVAVHRAYSAAHFGFTQALRDWPDNVDAQRGLHCTVEIMFEHQVCVRNHSGAVALLAEMPESAANERTSVMQELEAEARQHVLSSQKLQKIEREFDLDVSRRHRTFMFVAGAAYLFFTIVTTGIVRSFDETLGFGFLMATPVLLLLGGAVLGFGRRKQLLATTINRRIGFTLAALGVSILANRTLTFMAGGSIDHALLTDGLLVSVVAAVAGVTIRSLYLVPAVLFGTITTIATFYPDFAPLGLALAIVLSVLAVVGAPFLLTGRRWARLLRVPFGG